MFLRTLIQDALTAGTTPVLMKCLNYSILGLMLTMLFAVFVGYGDIHVCIMLFLATGLLASANWFYMELKKANATGVVPEVADADAAAPLTAAASITDSKPKAE